MSDKERMKMSYSIIRVQKVKGKVNTTGIQKHVQRENEKYENLDVDLERSYLNYDLVNEVPIDFNQAIETKIENNYTGTRKIRSDAVKHVDGIITSDSLFFDSQMEEQTNAFFKDAKIFLEEEYGKDNLIYATVHMDEKTPHMHYGVVPMTEDGRLSAKEVVGNKKDLTNFQDRFNQYMNAQGYDLQRGESKHKTERKHQQVERYKSETKYYNKERQEAKRISENVNREKQRSIDAMDFYSKKARSMNDEILNMQKQIEIEKKHWEEITLPEFKQRRDQYLKQEQEAKKKKDDLEKEQDKILTTFSSIYKDIDDLKDEKAYEKAQRNRIIANKEKYEQKYQSLKNVLNEPVNDEYEYEYKKPSLFAREKEATGKVIMKEEDYNQLKIRSDIANKLESEVTRLNSGQERQEDKQQIHKLSDENEQLKEEKQALSSENYKLKQQREKEQEEHDLKQVMFKHCCKYIKNFVGEKMYHKAISYVENKTKQQYKSRVREMLSVDDNDRQMFKDKEERLKREAAMNGVDIDLTQPNEVQKRRDKGIDFDK